MKKIHKTKKVSNWISKHLRFSVCAIFELTILLGVLLTYYFLPIFLNYGPGTINSKFDSEVSGGLTYFMQYFIIFIILSLLGLVFIIVQTRDFKNLDKIKNEINSSNTPESKKKLNKIILKCMTLPQSLFLFIALAPTIALSLAFILLGFTSFADVKVIMVITTISVLSASVVYIFFKNVFKTALSYLGNTTKLNQSNFSLTATSVMQISSLLLVSVIYTFLLLYSSNMQEKSDILKEHYTLEVNSIIENTKPRNINELKEVVNNMDLVSTKDAVFLIDNNNEFINFNNSEVSDFFIKYALELSSENENIVYDYYGTEIQGVVIPLTINNQEIKVIVKYDLSSHLLGATLSNMVIILIYCGFSIFFFSRSITSEISKISENMQDIATRKKDSLNEKLPVTSNDEIGDLVVAFNNLQDLTSQHINQIENNQQTLLEQERLASLGQMIGGIAHNLKTPIMSISGAAEGLTELVGEYIASIDNPQVNSEDHRGIAKDMLEWITKIKTHTAYMSDIITAVKGQASQLATSEYAEFSVYDLAKKVDILVKHEIKKALLTLETNISCDPTLLLHGDINNLIQVIINLISNSIQAYNGKMNEKVYLNISADNSNVYISVKDNGSGMSDEIKNKLFKEMITTKGKNGTGLGLYMSYSTIKGKFGGNIEFSSELNVGTTFTITIPLHKEE
ncbi:MAG: HAMP domain-containing protein [Clostridia bacterium]|nr:HAMP domain-containing protein [Clostridia bacterium]